MSHRQILRTQSAARQQIRALLESLFAAELLSPSRQVYLVSAWIRDIQVVDNRSGGFRGLDANLGRRSLRLAEVLRILVERGTELVLAVRASDDGNQDFIDRLESDLTQADRTRVKVVLRPKLHVKGLLAQHYAVLGSMNFTYSGVEVNEEFLHCETDPQKLAELRLEFEHAYGVPG